MALRDWLSGNLATATVATPATVKPEIRPSVAKVASVAVAESGQRKTEAAVETPESRWPEYAAALKSGALVACVYCRHYEGPPDTRALGHCAALDVEACPVTPFTCRRFERAW